MQEKDDSGGVMLRGELLLRLAMVSAGIGLHAFNEFAIVAALPRAAVAFDAESIIGLGPVLYMIGAVGGGMTGVLIRRRLGVRAAMLWGAAIFVLGAVIAMASPGMGALVFGRAISGLSDGLIMAVCYSLIPELFPARLVPRVFATEAVIWALAGVLGPLLGGGMTEWLGWRWAMVTALPVLAAFVLFSSRVLPAEVPDPAALGGLMRLWPVAVSLLGAAAISAPMLLASPGAGMAALTVGVALLVGAFWLDGRQTNPVFPQRSFHADAMGLGMWVMAIISFAHYLSQPFTALGLQQLFGLGATWVAAGSVILALSWSGVAIVTSAKSFDPLRRSFAWAGPLAQAAGASLVAAGMAYRNLPLVIAGQMLIGAGFGLTWGAVTQGVMESAPLADRDRAGGIMPTISSLGAAVGAGIGGALALQVSLPQALEQAGGAGQAALIQWGLAAACALVGALAGAGHFRARLRRTTAAEA